MQFVRELHDVPVESLRQLLAACPEPFAPSELYVIASDTKVVDTTQRVSSFRRLRDTALFDACESIVAALSEADPLSTFHLRRDDATHIVYKAGGFFKEHRDFLSVTSNVLEEYTLLVCVTPDDAEPVVGGGTRVTVNPKTSLLSSATTVPGRGLLFRKDLPHEGVLLESGEKHVLSLNLLATRKVDGPVLAVTFPDSGDAPTASLAALAEAQTYAITVKQLAAHPKCPLTLFAEMKAAELGPHAAVLPYLCTACTYDAFGVVFKALIGLYVSTEELVEHTSALEFFNINLSAVLVATAVADVKADTEHAETKTPLVDEDLIVCTSDQRTTVVVDAARRLRLPYVRFRLFFVEGTVRYEGDDVCNEKLTLNMQPVWASFGDYDNVLGVRNLCHLKEQPETLESSRPVTLWPALQRAVGADVFQATTALDLMKEQLTYGSDIKELKAKLKSTVPHVLPGAADLNADATPLNALFHIDSNGYTCFSAEEAKAAAPLLSKVSQKVQHRLRNLKLQLPQINGNFEGFFCNETVYGRCNFVEVTGAVRLARV